MSMMKSKRIRKTENDLLSNAKYNIGIDAMISNADLDPSENMKRNKMVYVSATNKVDLYLFSIRKINSIAKMLMKAARSLGLLKAALYKPVSSACFAISIEPLTFSYKYIMKLTVTNNNIIATGADSLFLYFFARILEATYIGYNNDMKYISSMLFAFGYSKLNSAESNMRDNISIPSLSIKKSLDIDSVIIEIITNINAGFISGSKI